MDSGLEGVDEVRKIIARYKGSVVITKVHNGGLMACPVCEKYYFTSEKDLILHIISHAKQGLYKYSHNESAPIDDMGNKNKLG